MKNRIAAVLALAFAMVLVHRAPAAAFTCKISADKTSVQLIGSNAQAKETSCTVHCDIRTSTGSTAIVECTKTLAANAKDAELCARTAEGGARYEQLLKESGSCVNQAGAADDDEDDDD